MDQYDTVEAVAALGVQDPELTEYLKSEEGQNNPMVAMSFKDMVKNAPSFTVPVPPITEYEYPLDIYMRDGFRIASNVFKPQNQSSHSPLVVLIHGGGFCMGEPLHLMTYARTTAELYGAVVVSISYRLAPEFKFPAAFDDVWDCLLWLTSAAAVQSLGYSGSAGFVIGGVSAGANLAAVAVQQWVTEKMSPPLTGLWLSIPSVLNEDIVPSEWRHLWISREQNANSMIINKAAMDYIDANYQQDFRSPKYSPFNAPDPHKGLPPTYVQVCGQDLLRDDGLIYEKALRANGVTTKLDVFPGVPHGWNGIFPTLNSSQRSQIDTMKGFGWVLGKDASEQEISKAWAQATAPCS